MANFDPVPYFHGIYALRNRRSGAMYVGCTRDLRERWVQHRYALRKGKHDQPLLQAAWDADGQSHFELVLLEPVELTDDVFATRMALLGSERKWLVDLCAKGVALYNKTLPKTAIVVVEWDSATMLPAGAAPS